MPSPLRPIARFFRNHLEIRMNPLMQTELTAGSIVDVDGLVDLDLYGELVDFGVEVPVVHSAVAAIPGIERTRSVNLVPSLSVPALGGTPLNAALSGRLQQSTAMSIGMTEVESRYIKQSLLAASIRDVVDSEGSKGALASALKLHHRRIIWKEYWGKLNMTFMRAGDNGASVALEVADVGGTEINGAWTWTSSATLESTQPRLFALEMSRWSGPKGRLEPRS